MDVLKARSKIECNHIEKEAGVDRKREQERERERQRERERERNFVFVRPAKLCFIVVRYCF